MKRILALALVLCCALSGLAVNATAEGTKGALQVGAGVANTTGGIELGMGFQVITLQAAGLLFPSPWAALIVDFSYGLPTTYVYQFDSDKTEFKLSASYVDGLLGVYKDFSEGGLVYLGVGVAIGFGTFEVQGDEGFLENAEIKSSIGFACGAGLTIPVTDRMSGFVNVRQRFITSELNISDDSDTAIFELSTGGTELNVGFSFMFGG